MANAVEQRVKGADDAGGGEAGGVDSAEDAGRGEGGVGGFLNEVHELAGLDLGLLVELDLEEALAAFDAFDADGLGQVFDLTKIDEEADVIGHGAVAVGEFGDDFGGDLGRFGVGDFFVGAEALVVLGDVGGGDTNFETEVERGLNLERDFFAFHFANGFFEHFDVHVEADGVDVAGLFAAEEAAGAAEFEIESGDLEAGAEVGEFLEGGEAFAGNFGEFGVGGNEEVGVSAAVGAADAAAELVKLAEAIVL